jgi:hypothetical protein
MKNYERQNMESEVER